MGNFDAWMLLAGMGIFLFGMYNLESALKFLAGSKFKQVLQNYTDTPAKSISVGTIVTAILQSSSLVSLIAIAFVGAGVMLLSNAVGVLIGANIGTTFTSLLVARLGFGKFKIAAFAFPLLAIGGLSTVFTREEKGKNRAKLIMGFGLLFLGLDFMKESVEVLQANFDLAAYADLGLPMFFVIGIIITIVLQSSSAVGVLTLAALNSTIIGFPASIAIIMGSNIGTTFTAVIASFGGKIIKRQLALGQVLFNIISAIIGIVFFRQYIRFVQTLLGIEDLILGNAVLNLVFNLSTALLFAPFLRPFTGLIEKILPEKEIEDQEVSKNESNSTPENEEKNNSEINSSLVK